MATASGRVRTLPRLQERLQVVVHDGWRGEVVDLSATGLRIRSLLEFPPGAAFDGELLTPDAERIPLRGHVVWSTPADHLAGVVAEVGVELDEVPPAYTALVAALFARAGEGD